MPWWLLGFGLASIVLLVGSDVLRQRSIVRDTAHVQAVGAIQRDTAISHLWLEEFVTGDQVDAAEISDRLRDSQVLLGVMTGEQPAGPQTPLLRRLREAALVREAEELALRLEEFRDISERRLEGYRYGLPVGVGSQIDVRYDSVFAEVLAHAERLEAALEERMAWRRQRSRTVLWSVVAAWSVLLALAAGGLWSRERRRRRIEASLHASQAQLFRSQKLEAVGRIAGGLAHDINNYLAAIRGHCELVRMKSSGEPRVARKMDAAIRTVLKASTLIDRLLAFGHRQPVQLEVVDLNRVVGGLERILRPSVGDDVRVVKRFADGLWKVEIDLAQLEQIVVNLMVNARDAMPTGGEIVLETANVERSDARHLALAATRPPADCVLLAVADTGCGISREARDKIFDPFWTTKKETGNSGLGLATVDNVVRQSGGSIDVESEVGSGTTFRIFLPRSDKPETRSSDLGEPAEEDLRGNETILLVDDNPDFRESSRALLEELGYRIVTAADGEEALGVFDREKDRIDLVLTDVVMPGLSGREMLDRMREQHDVRAIFMSGYTDDMVLRHGVEEGEVELIRKQFSSSELARRVREALDREPSGAAPNR